MKRRISETQLIQNYGVLFKNAKFESVLAGELAEYGYDVATIEQGEALYNTLIRKVQHQQNRKCTRNHRLCSV